MLVSETSHLILLSCTKVSALRSYTYRSYTSWILGVGSIYLSSIIYLLSMYHLSINHLSIYHPFIHPSIIIIYLFLLEHMLHKVFSQSYGINHLPPKTIIMFCSDACDCDHNRRWTVVHVSKLRLVIRFKL